MLTDGSLSPNAIKEINFNSDDTTTQPTPVPQPIPVSSPAPGAEVSPSDGAGPNSTSDQDPSATSNPVPSPKPSPVPSPVPNPSPIQDEIIITWSGPLTVRPIEDPATTPLATEQVALAFTSQDRITFVAPAQGITGSADQLRYGATTANLQLVGTNQAPIQITADQAGTLQIGRENGRASCRERVLRIV